MPDSNEDPDVFEGFLNSKNLGSGRTIDVTGTWYIPPVLLEAPDGLLTDMG